MLKQIFLPILLLYTLPLFAQDVNQLNSKGLELAREGKYDEALDFFDKSLDIDSINFEAWYFKSLIKSDLRAYDEALECINKAISIRLVSKEAFLQKGRIEYELTNYIDAETDYSKAIILDSDYAAAYYYRGKLYELLSKRDLACKDFRSAQKLGYEYADRKAEKCDEPVGLKIYPILELTKQAKDKNYGFSSEYPIKVGPGPDGGPANERRYLDLLRDPLGNSVKYERLRSCCFYKTENAIIGDMALLDEYEITYMNEKGKEKKVSVYISHYDYEEPKILFGFRTIAKK